MGRLTSPRFRNNARLQEAAENNPPLSTGSTGPAVVLLQTALIDLGYPMPISIKKKGSPDGIYGDETRRTVLKFQTDKGLSMKDGIAGRETLTALDRLFAGGLPPPPPPPPPPAPPSIPASRDYKIGTDDPTIAPDPGAGVWNSHPKTISQRLLNQAILEILPSAAVVVGADAAANMYHYFGNSGRDRTINLVGMVKDVPSAKRRYEAELAQAAAFVETLPVGTHQITSIQAENGYNRKSESWNWYFAVGGYSTWGKGRATVRDGPGGREYRLEFEYKFFDRYNWDTGKSVTIFGIEITDEAMGEFHRQGLAQEFDMRGSFRATLEWKHGEAPRATDNPLGGR